MPHGTCLGSANSPTFRGWQRLGWQAPWSLIRGGFFSDDSEVASSEGDSRVWLRGELECGVTSAELNRVLGEEHW